MQHALPDGIEESLPEAAWRLESLRRVLLDDYRERGYALVLPPLVEHLDSLLQGAGGDLAAQTFKFTDPQSGALLGLRADMTPQIARIAAKHFQGVARLCYLGSVLRTHPDLQGGSRSPRQVGCELIGVEGLEGDLEAVRLMLRTLALADITQVHLDVGHVGFYQSLISRLALSEADESALFEIVQRKSKPDLISFAAAHALGDALLQPLMPLLTLHGGVEVLDTADRLFPEQQAVLMPLRGLVEQLKALYPKLPIHVDLAELRGLRYHTGIVFAAFTPQSGRAIAQGGRYRCNERSGTGFSADLNQLLRQGA